MRERKDVPFGAICRFCKNVVSRSPGLIYCSITKRKEFTGCGACEEYIHDAVAESEIMEEVK